MTLYPTYRFRSIFPATLFNFCSREDEFENKEQEGQQMKKQVEDINRSVEISLGKHAQFFNNVRFWDKGGESYEDNRDQEDEERYLLNPLYWRIAHGDILPPPAF